MVGAWGGVVVDFFQDGMPGRFPRFGEGRVHAAVHVLPFLVFIFPDQFGPNALDDAFNVDGAIVKVLGGSSGLGRIPIPTSPCRRRCVDFWWCENSGACAVQCATGWVGGGGGEDGEEEEQYYFLS